MDREASEPSRERVVSSEPCPTRAKPFDNEKENSSRKRQRVSRGESRSISMDGESDSLPGSGALQKKEGTQPDDNPRTPRTPARVSPQLLPAEPTSSRVTINLRTTQALESIPSSPPSPITPSKMGNGGEDIGTRVSVESESDALSTVPAIETPSSSPSAIGSPEIELVPMSDDERDYGRGSPPVAIFDGDEMVADPMLDFPYLADQSLVDATRHISRFFQYDAIENEDVFCKVRSWMRRYLDFGSDSQTLHESYLKYQDFWLALPDLMWALNHRGRYFGQFLHRSRDGRQALNDLFLEFARLAGRFVAMDVATLVSHRENPGEEQEPHLGSKRIVEAYSFLLRKEEQTHIGRNLENYYQWNWDDQAANMMSAFEEEGGSIQKLTELVRGQLNLISRYPRLIENLVEPSRLVGKAVHEAGRLLKDSPSRHCGDLARNRITDGYDFFKVASAGLELIIDKHVTFLTPDAALCHLSSLFDIFEKALEFENNSTRGLIDERLKEYPQMNRKAMPLVLSHEWRFVVFKKLITSSQMQLRVAGTTSMCGDLLRIFTQEKLLMPPPYQNPVLLFLSEFVLQNKLIDYLVSIGSHPEIINESHNILGFLIVTKTYTSDLTDKIWQTVMTSQDPRVVEAILRMLRQCLNLYEYTGLLYLCRKACDLPIIAFNLPMRDFCDQLLTNLVGKATAEHIPSIDAPPYDLCVRLIRDSSIITQGCPAGYPEIQAFAAMKFQELLGHGPDSSNRDDIYASCLEDISLRTPTAPGSICVLNTLVKPHLATDLRTLTAQHGLTRLIIEELEHTVTGDRHSTVRNSPASSARRELLFAIIHHEPETITPDLGRRLWDHLVGSQSRSDSERVTCWHILNKATKLSSNNPFVSTCFTEYLPTLQPQCFADGTIEFARTAVARWVTEAKEDPTDDDRSFISPALEQIWKIVLTAPPHSIEAKAIGILVEIHVDSPFILCLPRPMSRRVHLALVDRCLRQLAAAASELRSFGDGTSSGEEDGMVIVPSEGQLQEQEQAFVRSLAVLKEFLKAYQSKPQFAIPRPKPQMAMTGGAVEGEPLMIKYQSFDGNIHTEIRSVTLGKQNTAAALLARLQKVTGFRNYKIYCGGKEFDPDEIELCKSLDDLNIPGLVLVQRRDDDERSVISSNGEEKSVDMEIVSHFEELWGYLSMQDKVAQEIYSFLVKFPIHEKVLKNFDSKDASVTEIFPHGHPFKCLYAIHGLRQYIAGQTPKGSKNEPALTRAISLIVAAICDESVIGSCGSEDMRDNLALHLIECLIQLLREPVLPTSVAPHLNEQLLARLLQLLYDGISCATEISLKLTCSLMEALFESSLHNPDFWLSFASHLKSNTLLGDLLLVDPRPAIRKNIAKQIANKCTFSPSLALVSSTTFMMDLWPMIVALIPETMTQRQNCEEAFYLANTLFKRLAETSIDFLNLGELVRQWGQLLISHKCIEVVGHPESIDMVAQGLVNLLYCATCFAKASQQPLSCSAIGSRLFRVHMFPEIHLSQDSDDEQAFAPSIPLLNPMTRCTMSEAIFILVKDDSHQYDKILRYLKNLVSYDDTIEDGPYSYDLPFLFERSKAIRSHTGYVGLKNLSNTCYLNSLFTQLFMNIPFREFMLTASIPDGDGSQKLLQQTQMLFSNMQNSLMRFVDPTQLTGSIRTYDETPIDVSIQMDVDEFYNLLFDRWETQILTPEAKKAFRSFYGGELVQQVKSKECPHISERHEPFSAIQCDIKGKSCLQESLQAYVDGEIMEGDNKYKCSQCDRHVDAVKRACLKDIPENLIFHLKRFDFNLRTLQRSKINDHFSFPQKIDMRPYKVEHLMDPTSDHPEDVFELVGILIHAGTAESGHYYSFIRERPSTGATDNWVEFNDDCVSPWDPNCMESATFGGIDYRGPVDNGNMPYDKSYSAYMLFYQRSSVLAAQREALETSTLSSPVQLPVLPALSNQITLENELLMRKYCLYDPSHVSFVSRMLSNVRKINGGHCSEDHTRERTALHVALNHLDQVVTRTKDLPEFQKFMLAIKQMCHSCAECTCNYLDWYCTHPDTLRHMLLRNPDGIVRQEVATSILAALQKVKSEMPHAYGLEVDGFSTDDEDEDSDPQLVQKIVEGLDSLFEIFHTNCRAWSEYFGLLASIAALGDLEACLILDKGYLRRTLEMVTADPLLQMTPQFARMFNIVSKRITTRPVNFDAVISLLWNLIKICDHRGETLSDNQQRFPQLQRKGGLIGINVTERDLLVQHWTRTNAHILVEKLLQIAQNAAVTKQIITHLMKWEEEELDNYIYLAITHGIKKASSSFSSGPFLKAAIIYCENTTSTNPVALVPFVAKYAHQIDNSEGRQFLHFFKEIIRVTTSPESEARPEHLFNLCLGTVNFWAPPLLTYYDSLVRVETEEFLTDLIISNGPDIDEPSDTDERLAVIIEAGQKLAIGCLDYLQDTFVRPRRQAVRSALVSIQAMIEHCKPFFDEDEIEGPSRQYFDMRSCKPEF
ncbi:ubiquitin C-terminal hydrolase-like protein [Amylocarpus encephaloides]|uniref:Ubiquitin C-terminal hydrolase-like protein n=1 Tax=Amylocarpus encephaloides TaxID=45428 RepID=A0A9P7YFC6_9HELO|nr:ubiquitin C-terminal hydrolase-like protein [Amylocarpus encephaloides]